MQIIEELPIKRLHVTDELVEMHEFDSRHSFEFVVIVLFDVGDFQCITFYLDKLRFRRKWDIGTTCPAVQYIQGASTFSENIREHPFRAVHRAYIEHEEIEMLFRLGMVSVVRQIIHAFPAAALGPAATWTLRKRTWRIRVRSIPVRCVRVRCIRDINKGTIYVKDASAAMYRYHLPRFCVACNGFILYDPSQPRTSE